MFWNKYLIPSILILVIVAALHWVASYEGFYWEFNWYDYVMHFLGGLWAALFLLWISRTGWGVRHFRLNTAKAVVGAVLLVGLCWELYELAFHFTSVHGAGYAWDTAHDFIMDAFGACAAALLYRKSLSR